MNKKSPEIRFKGFTDDWEQRKLQEILKVNSGRDYKHLGSGSIPVYGSGGYMLSVNDKLSDKDAIGIGRKGTIDKPQYLKAPFWTVDTLFFMTPLNNFDLQFLYTMTQKVNWKKMDESTGVPSLSKAVIEKINQNIPSYQEQIIIGRFFKQLDETIVLHQVAIQRQQDLKKALLQKLFPVNGERIPTVRFANFKEEWEQRKFKDFIYKAGKKNTNDDDFPAYSVSNKFGLVRQSEHFNESRLDDLDKTAYKLVNPGEFAYNPARINVGSIAFNNLPETVIVSSLYVVLKMNNKLDNEYILQFIKSRRFTNEVIKNTEGSVREYLFFDNFKNIKFPYINSKEEQAKIGGLFRQLDETIALHQDAIHKLQLLKQSLLQKMFVN